MSRHGDVCVDLGVDQVAHCSETRGQLTGFVAAASVFFKELVGQLRASHAFQLTQAGGVARHGGRGDADQGHFDRIHVCFGGRGCGSGGGGRGCLSGGAPAKAAAAKIEVIRNPVGTAFPENTAPGIPGPRAVGNRVGRLDAAVVSGRERAAEAEAGCLVEGRAAEARRLGAARVALQVDVSPGCALVETAGSIQPA